MIRGIFLAIKTKLRLKRTEINLLIFFYVIIGLAEIYFFVLTRFRLITLGIFGFLNFIAAYGLIKNQSWTRWVISFLFFTGITLGATTLYSSTKIQTFFPNLMVFLFHLIIITYLFMVTFTTIYFFSRRKTH
jgi:hypothetical protein